MSVYTPINRTELNTFLSQYAVGQLTQYTGISSGIENTNYFVDTDQARYVLTLFEHHNQQELHYFIDLMLLLAESGVPTAKPIAQQSGQVLSLLKGKPALLVSCLTGSTLEDQQPTVTQCAAIGTALAKMHIAGQHFSQQRTPDRGVEWRAMMGTQLLQHPDLDAQDQKILQAELHYQANMDYSALPSGVIHADLFRDNAMFAGDTLSGIIDFYYACSDSFLFDIAVVVNDWCYPTPDSIDTQKLSALLNAYHAIRPLQATEQTQWFAMLKAAALRFWLSRLYDQLYPREGELTQSKDPNEFKHKLAVLENSQQQLADHWPHNATTYVIDARRLLCPMPVIRVQEMIETLQTGDRIIATCTDAGVMHDIPAWVRVHGHQVISAEADNNEYIITVEVV